MLDAVVVTAASSIDVTTLTRDNLRRVFGMVPPDSWLFGGTIRGECLLPIVKTRKSPTPLLDQPFFKYPRREGRVVRIDPHAIAAQLRSLRRLLLSESAQKAGERGGCASPGDR